jgi:hypothetical protein
MELPLTQSVADSHAKTFHAREVALELMVRAAGYGGNIRASLANYDLNSSSWKTSQFSFHGDLTGYSGTWPKSGMTRNGIAFRRAPLVPLTDGTASGLWPTPKTGSNRNSRQAIIDAKGNGKHKSDLSLAQAIEVMAGILPRELRTFSELPPQWKKKWPTPTANRRNGLQSHGVNMISGSLNPMWVEWLMGFPLGWTDLGR